MTPERLIDFLQRRSLPLLIAVAGIWAYHNSLSGPFIFDDRHDITQSARVHDLWNSWQTREGSWRPVGYFSFALNYQFGGLNPRSYHLLNLLIHILAALVLFGFVQRTLLLEPLRAHFERLAAWLSLAVALLWEVHPLQTECVTYIVHRYEALMGLFYLLTLYCVVRGVQSKRYDLLWYVAAILSCALGMGSKETMVTAPVMVLLYDRIFLAGAWRAVVRRRGLLHVCLAATWAIVAMPLGAAVTAKEAWAGFGIQERTPWEYARTQFGVLLHYLRLAFWPDPLCVDYAWPIARDWQAIVLPAVPILILLLATVWALWHRPRLGFVGVWFFLILAPTSSIMPIADLAVERRMYLPLAAVIVLVVLAGHGCLELWARRAPIHLPGIELGIVALLAAVLGWTTIRRNEVYASEETVWRDVTAKAPENYRGHNNLAEILQKKGENQEAVSHFEKALALQPRSPDVLRNLGTALEREGRTAEAIGYYRRALEVRPEFAPALTDLGTIELKQGKTAKAGELFVRALKSSPEYPQAHHGLGCVLIRQGKWEEAGEHFAIAIHIMPDYAEAYDNLGFVLCKQGQYAQAANCFIEVLQRNPGSIEMRIKLTEALRSLGQTREADEQYRKILQSHPHWPETTLRTAWALATHPDPKQRDGPRALLLAEQLCRAAGGKDANQLAVLAAAYAENGRYAEATAAAHKALDLANAARQMELVRQIQECLALYKKSQPFREAQTAIGTSGTRRGK